MLTRDKNYLSIFTDRFEIDYQLPKYGEVIENIKKDILGELVNDESSMLSTIEDAEKALTEDPDALMNFSSPDMKSLAKKYTQLQDLINKYQAKKEKMGILLSSEKFDKLGAKDLIVMTESLRVKKEAQRWMDSVSIPNLVIVEKVPWWKRLWKKKEEEGKEPIDVLEFFRLVKLTTEQSEQDYIDRSQPYLLAIEKAKEMGQQALIDKYLARMFVAKYESILRAEGFDKSITEEQVVSFARKSVKGLSLTYIKNYTRSIPDEIIEKKKKADELYVFDNYCVLHYDPEKKGYAMTAKEKETERQRKADPILFGMIENCRKLYYIGDWVDEYCDLTLEQFLKESGLTEKDIEIPKEIWV